MRAENVIGRTHLVTVSLSVGKVKKIWIWAKQRQAWILRTVPQRIPSDWLQRPNLHRGPQDGDVQCCRCWPI